jgi:prolyl oligopeptidase
MKKGSKYFFWKNSGLQNQDVLYVQDSLDGPEREFLDPAKIREDGTASIGVYRFSKNGEKLAYGVNFSGSDWSTIYVKDVLTGEQLSDELQWVKFSGISWTHDHKGFFYCRYNPAEGGAKDSNSLKNQRVYYHTVGTPQTEDKLIFAVPAQPSWMFGCEVSQDGKYLIISISHSTQRVNRLYYLLLDNLQFDAEGLLTPVLLVNSCTLRHSHTCQTH